MPRLMSETDDTLIPETPGAALGEWADARYELLHKLGEGAAGAVFLARDKDTGEELALKQLFRLDQRSVLRFKREFRLLADLHHPNCVKLYDLQRGQDVWFLTMEYIAGADLESALIRPLRARGDARRATRDPRAGHASPDAAHVGRVAHAFSQLAQGVRVVHQAGLLHRDLKPSNVLLAHTGRVVVLDFGLVRGMSAPQNDVTMEGTVAGTPAYMPPEQALGERLTEASDWYAFGVMLYESLCGRLPIDASSAALLIQKKLSQDPAPLPLDTAPPELAQLCAALLRRDASARPGVDEILLVLSRLDVEPPRETTITEELALPHAAPARAPFFGRSLELALLEAALSSSRTGSTVVAHVHGTSGSGKSSLVEHFLLEVQDRTGGPIVLRSRCYEREAMPFKALDGVMDALVWHLAQMQDVDVAHLLPVEVTPLTQLFPALERVRAVQRLLTFNTRPRVDAAQVRRRAEQGLRELIANVSRRQPLILWVDDLQWGDLDSACLLQDWIARPLDTPVLLILTYRSDEISTSPCLSALLSAPSAQNAARYEIGLTPLSDADVQALCEQRVGSGRALSPAFVARIVREAQGNAFLATQLAALAHAKLARGEAQLEALSVQELVLQTTALLSEPERELLSVLAIAGRPVTSQLALNAANAAREGRAHIHALQGLRLLRTRTIGDARMLEVYHDRVREAVSQALTPARSELLHDRVLRAAESSGRADPGWLHELALGASQRQLALRYGRLAAEVASASLAFERAAELYARCAVLAEGKAELADIWQQLGLADARCRRGAAAAESYLRASELVKDQERVHLLQMAASHLLRSGRYEAGERLVGQILAALNIEVPSTRAGMYAAIAWESARAKWLLGRLKPRAGVTLPPEELIRGEYCGLVAVDTQSYAPLRAALLQTRALRIAFQYGEVETTARALALSATLGSLRGTTVAARKADAKLDRAEHLSREADKPSLRLEILSARAVCALSLGKMSRVIEASTAANAFYESKSAGGQQGDYYYMFAVRAVRIAALQNLGQHKEAAAELRELLNLAEATSNRAAVLQATLVTTSVEQVSVGCAGSRERLDRERQELPSLGTGLLHVLHMTAVLRTACITGEHDWALSLLERFWPEYEESPVQRSAYLAYLLHSARARLLLNRHATLAAAGGNGLGDPAASVRADLKRLSGHAPEPFRPCATARLAARIALLRGDEPRAVEQLHRSHAAHAEIGAVDEAARDRWALGSLLGGSEGQAHTSAALERLRLQGIADPLADLRGYYPELLQRG